MIVRYILKSAAFAVILFASALLGWYMSGGKSLAFFPQPWTCTGLLALGLCLHISIRPIRNRGLEVVRSLLAAFVLLLAVAFATEYLFNLALGLDTFAFPKALGRSTNPGRPAPGSILNLFALSLALLLYRSKRNFVSVVCEAAALTSLTFCYLQLVNFALQGPVGRDGMPPLSATLFLLTSIALVFSRSDGQLLTLFRSASAAGIFARWLMPVPLILPVFTRLVTRTSTHYHILESPSGAVLTFLNILCAVFIVWGASTQVLRLDRLRRRAEDDLRHSRDDLDRQVRLRTQELVLSNQQLTEEIAERQRAEQEIQVANATLSNLVDASPLAICAWNTDGSIRKSNAAADALLGPNADLFEPLIERAKTGEVITGAEVSRSGQQFYQVWASPLLTLTGTPNGTLFLAADISERKAFDAKLLQTQKLESLGVLAGGIAHDFNNLLTGIMGNASILLETQAGDPFAVRMLNQVVNASRRAADLTSQMLAYAGKGKFVVLPVDLSKLVREIGALIESSVGRQVRVRFELDDKLPLMQMDPSQIQQVVMNLVINAAEAIAGSGEVLVATSVQPLDVDFIRRDLRDADLPPGLYVKLEVRDNGPGMDEATMARIFEPFFTTKFTGRGLGLAAVHGILRSHSAGLQLNSALGKGTCFQLFFPASNSAPAETEAVPLAPAPPPVKKTEVAPHPASGQRRTVLVVDDEPTVREVASRALAALDYDVALADSGDRALEIVRDLAVKPNLILLDLTMPGLSGRETHQRLKEADPGIPILVSSGFDETEAEGNFDTPLDGFLKKPYTAPELANAVHLVLHRASVAEA